MTERLCEWCGEAIATSQRPVALAGGSAEIANVCDDCGSDREDSR